MCDTFVVVKPGRVLFGKNSDRDPNEAQVLSWVPARSHAPDATLRCTWIDIPQVSKTHAIVLSRPFWMWGAEMGANERGVAIGNEAIFTREPLQDEGLLGMDLVRLGLERGDTADAAKDVICELIERFGQGGRCGYDNAGFSYHNSFLIADASRTWVVEAAGKTIATRPIDQGVYAISNGITLQELLPREDRIRPRIAMASRRRERVTCLAESVSDATGAIDVLRDHGENLRRPRYRRFNGAMGAPCMHAGGWPAASQTVGSFVAELRSGSQRYWATGTAAPCLSVFRPISIGAPHEVGEPTGTRDESLWWRFETVHRALIAAGDEAVAEFTAERGRVQARVLESPEPDAWRFADSWLQEWQSRLAGRDDRDQRQAWLRRYWRRLDTASMQPSRLPWRPA